MWLAGVHSDSLKSTTWIIILVIFTASFFFSTRSTKIYLRLFLSRRMNFVIGCFQLLWRWHGWFCCLWHNIRTLPLGASSLLSIFPHSRDAAKHQHKPTLRDLIYHLPTLGYYWWLFIKIYIYIYIQAKAQGSVVHPASAVCHLHDLVWCHVWAAWLPTGVLVKLAKVSLYDPVESSKQLHI